MKPLKIVLALFLCIGNLSASTTNVITNSEPTCDEVLAACDKAVGALEHEVNILKDLNAIRAEEIDRLRAREDAWQTNRWLWLGAGLLVGVAGGVYLSK